MPGGRVLAVDPERAQVPEVGERVAERRHLPVEDGGEPHRRHGREQHVAEPEVAVHDGRRRRLGAVGGQPARDAVERRELTRAVALPQPGEARELALEVAVRAAEALEAGRAPVDRVEGDERVDERRAHRAAVRLGVERRRHRLVDHDPVDPLHHVERRADHGVVVARGQHPRHGRATLERAQHARLAQHVVRAGRQRAARRAAEHEVRAVAAQRERDVRVAVADRRDLRLARAEAVRVEPGHERLEDEQRLARALRQLRARAHDVVRGERVRAHSPPDAARTDSPCGRQLEHVARDRHPVHLAGPVVDPRRARVLVDAGDRQVHGDARGAVHLHRAVGDPAERLRDERLRHRHLLPVRQPLLDLPRGVEHHQPARVQVHRRVGEHELQALVARELLAERAPLQQPPRRQVERALGEADPAHRVREPPARQPLLGDDEALALARRAGWRAGRARPRARSRGGRRGSASPSTPDGARSASRACRSGRGSARSRGGRSPVPVLRDDDRERGAVRPGDAPLASR